MKNLEKIAIDWAYTQESHAKPTDAVSAYMAGYKQAVSQMQADIDRLAQALSLIERITISDEQIEDYVLRNTPVVSQARAEAAIHWAVKQMRADILEKIKPTK